MTIKQFILIMAGFIVIVTGSTIVAKEKMHQTFDEINAQVESVYDERDEKLQYAINNGFSFYLNGENVTDQINEVNLDSYQISFDKYNEKKIMLSAK